MVRSLVKSASKVRPYVMLIAYGIVLSDVMKLVQELAQEFVLSRFFPHKGDTARPEIIAEINKEWNKRLEQTSEFENVENGVTNVTKRNGSYKKDIEEMKRLYPEVALQAALEDTLPGTV